MRDIAAWFLGFCTVVLVLFGLNFLFSVPGIPVYIEAGQAASLTDMLAALLSGKEIGDLTDPGIYAVFAGMMLAWRILLMIKTGRADGGLTHKKRALWFCSMAGATMYVAVVVILWESGVSPFIIGPVSLLTSAGVAWFFHSRYKARMMVAATVSGQQCAQFSAS